MWDKEHLALSSKDKVPSSVLFTIKNALSLDNGTPQEQKYHGHSVAVVALQPCAFMGHIDGVSEQGCQGLVMVKWSRADILATELFIPYIHFSIFNCN